SNSRVYINAVNKARQVKTGGAIALLCIAINIFVWGSINRLTILGIVLSISMLLEGWRILRILRKESTTDPDCAITRKRTLTGMTTSSIAGLAGIIWFLFWIFSH